MKTLFSIHKASENLLTMRLFEIRLQWNLSFRLCRCPQIPFCLELGLGLITISYEVWRA